MTFGHWLATSKEGKRFYQILKTAPAPRRPLITNGTNTLKELEQWVELYLGYDALEELHRLYKLYEQDRG